MVQKKAKAKAGAKKVKLASFLKPSAKTKPSLANKPSTKKKSAKKQALKTLADKQLPTGKPQQEAPPLPPPSQPPPEEQEQEKVGEWLEQKQKLICFSDQAGKLRFGVSGKATCFSQGRCSLLTASGLFSGQVLLAHSFRHFPHI